MRSQAMRLSFYSDPKHSSCVNRNLTFCDFKPRLEILHRSRAPEQGYTVPQDGEAVYDHQVIFRGGKAVDTAFTA